MDFAAGAAVALLALAVAAGWLLALVGLPGNWVMVAAAGLYAWLGPTAGRLVLTWQTVVVLVVFATIGEILEAIAGAWGARRAGGSRRAALYSLLASIAGAIVGAGVGIPIPVIGSFVGAIAGGAVGAMVGAVFAEYSLGGQHRHSWRVGQAAFWGRLLGVGAKVAVGSAMVVTVAAAVIW